MLLILMVIAVVIIQPFTACVSHFSYINAKFLLLLAMWCVSVSGLVLAEMKDSKMVYLYITTAVITAFIPLVYKSVIILRWLHGRRNFGLELISGLEAGIQANITYVVLQVHI